jgi:hypothetical protein
MIPFRSMRFPEAEEQDWQMNVFRLIRRKNEFTYWSPQPRQFSNYKISYGGRITGIRNVSPGRNIQIKPFLTGAFSNLRIPTLDRRWDGDGGIDAKVGIGTSLALDLTVHTDFSQVEADEQQINLTRFSLFFPEKREFFLENQGAFRIGDLQGRTLIPFFSRRIGLSAAGEPIPILGGARLTGRQGDYTLGLLNIQTEEVDGRPGDNYTTLRAARNFGGSSVGGFISAARPRRSPDTTGWPAAMCISPSGERWTSTRLRWAAPRAPVRTVQRDARRSASPSVAGPRISRIPTSRRPSATTSGSSPAATSVSQPGILRTTSGRAAAVAGDRWRSVRGANVMTTARIRISTVRSSAATCGRRSLTAARSTPTWIPITSA